MPRSRRSPRASGSKSPDEPPRVSLEVPDLAAEAEQPIPLDELGIAASPGFSPEDMATGYAPNIQGMTCASSADAAPASEADPSAAPQGSEPLVGGGVFIDVLGRLVDGLEKQTAVLEKQTAVLERIAADRERRAHREETADSQRVAVMLDPSHGQCQGQQADGSRCILDAVSDGLCKRHWRLSRSH